MAEKIQRVKSGIEGFDDIVKGGIPAGDVVLLTGTPGSGKTTFSMQFLAYGARNGEKGVYFTLEESANSIIKQFSVFDPGIVDLIKNGSLKIVEVPLVDFDTFKETLTSEIEGAQAKRVIIDSITYFQMFFPDVISIRKGIIEVATILRTHNTAGILVGEIPYGEEKLSSFGVEEFAADAVVALYLIEKESTFLRAIRVVKMRGTDHLTKFCPMEITDKGIVIYPNAELFAEVH
ncbi:MAG: gas vesicle protein GvpD [Nanoarchaeota archaeon]|nr:gas vesicle protein GvpD [Nanoarchaeota archaeon]